jgi:hypothetical protein
MVERPCRFWARAGEFFNKEIFMGAALNLELNGTVIVKE